MYIFKKANRLTYNIVRKYSTSTLPKPSIAETTSAEQKPNVSDPLLNSPDYFNVHNLFTVKDLFDARVHYGHKEGSLDEHKTAEYLRRALNIAAHVAYKDGVIVFFLRGAQNAHIVEKTAVECGEYAHTRFWSGGIFTNADKQFGTVTRLPDLCIFFNTLNNILLQHTAVRDSAKMGIATIGIVDSNCNPNMITYPVPGNDDSPSAIQLYCKLFKNAISRGKEKRKEHLMQT